MTWTAIEILPGGRERVLARGLTLAQLRAYPNTGPWALAFRQERKP